MTITTIEELRELVQSKGMELIRSSSYPNTVVRRADDSKFGGYNFPLPGHPLFQQCIDLVVSDLTSREARGG